MKYGHQLPFRLREKILKSILQEKGIAYLSCNFTLTEDFIQNNADYISEDHDWIQILLNQRHISPGFFDQFRADMGPSTIIMLDYRKSIIHLEKILEAIKKNNYIFLFFCFH